MNPKLIFIMFCSKKLDFLIKSILVSTLIMLIYNSYLIALKSHSFHIDEYYFIKKTYFFDLLLKRDFSDRRWQEDNFNQPKLGPYIYGLNFKLQGIKDIESVQNKTKFNTIKINNRFWYEALWWKRLENYPQILKPATKLIYQARIISVSFTLAIFALILTLGSVAKKFLFSYLAILLLSNNLLMWYYGRMAMTDSFQLFFFFVNLMLVFFYLKALYAKKRGLFLWLSFFIGFNCACAAGVKVIGVLALLFFLAIFLALFLTSKKRRIINPALFLVSLLIIIVSFSTVFVGLNPQIYSQPIKGFFKMFITRWQATYQYQLTQPSNKVSSELQALKLIFQKLLLPKPWSNFGYIPLVPIDLILTIGGVFLLGLSCWRKYKSQKQLGFEFLLLGWLATCFTSLVFYLNNDWPRYYLPLSSAITLVQASYLAFLFKRLFSYFEKIMLT